MHWASQYSAVCSMDTTRLQGCLAAPPITHVIYAATSWYRYASRSSLLPSRYQAHDDMYRYIPLVTYSFLEYWCVYMGRGSVYHLDGCNADMMCALCWFSPSVSGFFPARKFNFCSWGMEWLCEGFPPFFSGQVLLFCSRSQPLMNKRGLSPFSFFLGPGWVPVFPCCCYGPLPSLLPLERCQAGAMFQSFSQMSLGIVFLIFT